jgi:hypothetical protein
VICLKPGQTFDYTPRSRRDEKPAAKVTLRALSAAQAIDISRRIDEAKAKKQAATGASAIGAIFDELRLVVTGWTLAEAFNPEKMELHLTLGEAQELLAVAISGVIPEEALGN